MRYIISFRRMTEWIDKSGKVISIIGGSANVGITVHTEISTFNILFTRIGYLVNQEHDITCKRIIKLNYTNFNT